MGSVRRVSIGIPVYNGERYLATCLDSLLGQTFADFEVIVSDNCSTDATREISLDYAGRDARIRYSRNERNIGHFANHRLVAERASGAYFRWMAYDDLCRPTHLERCVAALDRSPEAVLAYTRTTFFDERGGELVEIHSRAYEDDHVDLPMGSAVRRLLGLVRHLAFCNAFYGLVRTDVLRTTSLIKPVYGADRILLAELAVRGRFVEVDEPLYLRRIHPHQVSKERLDEVVYADAGKPRFELQTLRLLVEHVRIIREAPASAGERALGLATVLPLLLWRRKRKLAVELLENFPRTYRLARRTRRRLRGLAAGG
jgi:glycosyltransferase involved in cell wall biosynthesis